MVSGETTSRPGRRLARWAGLAVLLAVPAATLAVGQFPTLAEHSTIKYAESTPTDAIARLQQRIDAGEVTLTHDDGPTGYLRSLLHELDVPESSQGLVFSKTSLQLDRIAPWSPRAIYFNEDVYIGFVQNGPILEISSVDPKLGAVFYTLSQSPADKPQFHRETTTCLLCHDSSAVTGGVPGFIVRSMYTDRYGYGITAIGGGVTTDQTPIEERWGGWYVTGKSGTQAHAGNIMAPVLAHEVDNVRTYMSNVDLGAETNVTDIEERFDTTPYLRKTSDIVSLLVLAHQAYVHNLVTIAGYETRKAIYEEGFTPDSERGPDGHAEATRRQIGRIVEPLVKALLFVKEAPLAAPIEGTSGFTADFQAKGKRDQQGRSLRDLDLHTRLFKYPLSYLIYSDGFNALPDLAREQIYRRLGEVLSGADQSPDFKHLSAADRGTILEILRDTKPEFARATAE
ncbi:MAG: hypothetical protein AB7H88_12050 [Vicinamibacterales bacterium]